MISSDKDATKDYNRRKRRHETQKVIEKRIRIMKDVWGLKDVNRKERGRFAKFNLVCSCDMCKGPKYNRDKEKLEIRRVIEEMEEELGE